MTLRKPRERAGRSRSSTSVAGSDSVQRRHGTSRQVPQRQTERATSVSTKVPSQRSVLHGRRDSQKARLHGADGGNCVGQECLACCDAETRFWQTESEQVHAFGGRGHDEAGCRMGQKDWCGGRRFRRMFQLRWTAFEARLSSIDRGWTVWSLW